MKHLWLVVPAITLGLAGCAPSGARYQSGDNRPYSVTPAGMVDFIVNSAAISSNAVLALPASTATFKLTKLSYERGDRLLYISGYHSDVVDANGNQSELCTLSQTLTGPQIQALQSAFGGIHLCRVYRPANSYAWVSPLAIHGDTYYFGEIVGSAETVETSTSGAGRTPCDSTEVTTAATAVINQIDLSQAMSCVPYSNSFLPD